MIRLETAEDRLQYDLLLTAIGAPGSGRTRYAAAMYFHQRGMIGDQALEAYRICCKQDDEDPVAVLCRMDRAHEVELPPAS
jgi:hypothetical protein